LEYIVDGEMSIATAPRGVRDRVSVCFSGRFSFPLAQLQVQGFGSTAMTNSRVQRTHQDDYETVFLFVSLEIFPFSLTHV
jgi:hypothetical protein